MRIVVDTAGAEIHGDDVFVSVINTQVQRRPFPISCLRTYHSPAPNTFSPMESIRTCRGRLIPQVDAALGATAADLPNNAISADFSLKTTERIPSGKECFPLEICWKNCLNILNFRGCLSI